MKIEKTANKRDRRQSKRKAAEAGNQLTDKSELKKHGI